MAHNRDRSPPAAYVDAGGYRANNRRIVLTNSRGSQKIDPAEARALAEQLVRSAEQVETETQEKQPCN